MSRPHSGGFSAAFDPIAALAAGKRRRMTPEHFWTLVDRTAPRCWEFQGRLDKDGYGIVSWAGRDTRAHRVAYAISYRPLHAGEVVRHACDNPRCCRPEHLTTGTIADNNADMKERGRARTDQLVRSGTANHNAKLNDDTVRALRAAWRAGESIQSIARRTGLTVGTVHPMLHGKTWKHVGQEAAE